MYATVKPLAKTRLLCKVLTISSVAGLGAGGALPFAVQAQTNCAAAPSGLVSWWKAESNGNDSAGTNNAVLSGVGFASGEVGQAFSFVNTTGAPVRVPASATLDVGAANGLTLEAWINPADVNVGHPVIDFNSGSYGVCLWVANWGQSSVPGSLYADVKDTSLNDHAFQSAGGLLVTNSFQHVALTYDKTSGAAALYINGLVVTQKNLGTFRPFTTSDMYIGYRPYDGGAGSRFVGQIDEASIYSRALASNAIAAIYSAGSAGKCTPTPSTNCVPPPSGLVSWWRGEGDPSDQIGVNNGALIGGTAFSAGRVGQCFLFGGNGDAVMLGNSPNLQLQDFTIEAWIKRASATVSSKVTPDAEFLSYGSGGFGFGMWSDGRLFLTKLDADNLTTTTGITDTNFHHVAVTKSGSTVVFYIDASALTVPAYNSVFTFSSPIAIGARGDNLNNSFYGSIDELTVYSRALSGPEVGAIYNAAGIGKCLTSAPPFIISQPVGQTVNVGAFVAFSVVAGGTAPVTYQWRLNGTNLNGATTSRLLLTNVQFANAGNYSVALTNAAGRTNSSDALLNVNPSPPCTPLPSGLVSWWKAEGNTLDEVGTNQGTLTGNTAFGAGEVGQAFFFDGNSDAVQLNNSATLQLQSFTIEAWIKRRSTSASSLVTPDAAILGFGSGGYGFGLFSDGRLFLTKWDTDNVTSTIVVSDTNFHHVAVTKNNSSVVFYIDGAAQSVAAYSSVFSFTTPAAIGARGDNLNNGFYGTVDELAVYNRALAANEIASIYNAGTGGKCSSGAPQTNCVPAASGLVSWWRAEGNANDSADSNNGVLQGGTAFAPGKVGQAFSFDGTSAFVQVADAPTLRFTTAMTIEAWIYPHRSGGQYREIVSKWEGGSNQRSYTCNINPDGRFNCGISIDGINATGAPSTNTIPTNAWTHVAAVFDGSSLAVYVNGQFNNSVAQTHSIFPGTAPLIIGSTLVSGSYFDGLIDEPTVYNRALTATEIAAIYNAGTAGKCGAALPNNCVPTASGLVSWWAAEGNASDAADSNNGTLQGGISFAPGKVGQAFSLNGSNAYVSFAASSNLNVGVGSGLTIEGWINPADISSTHMIAEWNNGSGGIGVHLFYSDPGNGGIGALSADVISTGGVDHRVSSPANLITAGNFQHIALTYDKSSGSGKLYRNGVEVATQSLGVFTPQTTYGLNLGARVSGGPSQAIFYKGLLDELSLYGRALSASEIAAIYSAGSAGKCGSGIRPSIVTQPQDIAVNAGADVTFNVTVSGTSPLSYQWRKNASDIPNATSSAYVILNAQIVDAGNYSVFVTNAFGSVVSSNVALTVTSNCVTPPSGLVSWWAGEGNANDSGDGNNGMLQGGTSFAVGKVGQAFSLNGSNAYVSFAASSNLNVGVGSGLTIEGWINPADISSTHMIAEWNNGSGGIGVHLFYSDPGNGGIGALSADVISTGGVDHRVSSPANLITAGNFQHIALTYDKSSGSGKLYRNGVEVATQSLGVFTPQTTYGLNLGARVSGGPSQAIFYKGLLDELSLYGRALSASEIAAIYNAAGVGKCTQPATNCLPPASGIVSMWKAEGDANDGVDSNNGVLQGGATFAPGKVGQAFSFNGTSASVQVADAANLHFATTMTLEAWVNPRRWGDHIREIISKWEGGTEQRSFTCKLLTDGRFDVGISIGGSASAIDAYSTGAIPTNSWTHIAAVCDTNSLSVYVNGQLNSRVSLTTGIFPGTAPLIIGSTLVSGSFFDGLIDEASLYSQALSSNEIAAIYNAGSAGKCATQSAPFVVAQPQNQTVTVGASASFIVGAGGTPPLTYQWKFNGGDISGATGSSFTIVNAQPTNAGLYSVAITNTVGFAISSNAVLTVNPGPSLLRVANASVASGGTVTVPVLLTANGNENALSFSISFSTNRLTYVNALLANGAGATLFLNESQTATGRLGAVLGLPAGQTFPPGAQELIEIEFTAAIVTNATTTPITFGDQPIVRQVSDVAGQVLSATYTAGSVAIAAVQYEADVSPRPNGDKAVTVTDWVLIGRFAAGLDFPTNATEFQRADCAPRATLGNGRISITDWVQAGRYAAGLDPLTPVGGPTSPAPAVAVSSASRPIGPRPLTSRQVNASGSAFDQGQSGSISISLQSQGNENALGFSLLFDPTSMSYTGATLGSGAAGANLNVNTDEVGSGRVGFALALGSGANFAPGSDELVKVTFQAAPNAPANVPISFADDPIYREVSDAGASVLTADYVGTAITVNPVPSLSINQTGQGILLAWPSWATNFVLQQSYGGLGAAASWTNASTSVITSNSNSVVTVPIESTARFYRLLKQ